MFRSYIKVAVRNLLKFRVYSVINVMGLSIAIAALLEIAIASICYQAAKAATTNPVDAIRYE